MLPFGNIYGKIKMRNNKRTMVIPLLTGLLCLSSCEDDIIRYDSNDLRVCIEQGDEWLHNYPLFLGLKKKNPPQIAVWIEDTNGNYISTLYVSHKIAHQAWQAAGGNRRKEALPHWCHKRGVIYEDGLYLPTKQNPVADGISGATPQNGFSLKISPTERLKQFVVKVEVNHSTDFNDYWPKSAKEGDENYSGGKDGSGQPAVVYAANVDLNSGERVFVANLIGHSSPDGSNGDINPNTSTLTSALNIVKSITIEIQ
jgi:hypothetical protein